MYAGIRNKNPLEMAKALASGSFDFSEIDPITGGTDSNAADKAGANQAAVGGVGNVPIPNNNAALLVNPSGTGVNPTVDPGAGVTAV